MADDDFVAIDIAQVSTEIPSTIQQLIGHGIIEFSRLETLTEHIIWGLLNLEYEDGQLLISKLDASRKFQILKEILERRFPETKGIKPSDSIWRAITTLTEARNKIAHSSWVLVAGAPFILSHKWKGPKGIVMAEPFPHERLERFGRLAKNLTKHLQGLSRALAAHRAKSAPQSSTGQ